MVEIPRLENGDPYIECGYCPAKTIREQKVYCDETRIKRRPRFCPLPAVTAQPQPDVYAMLREKLRHTKP